MSYRVYAENKSKLHLKGKDGKWKEIKTPPKIFGIVQEETGIKSIYGSNLKNFNFGDLKNAKSSIYAMGDGVKDSMFGLQNMATSIISDMDMDKIGPEHYHLAYFDIETECENGFPDPELALEEINMITVISNKNDIANVFTTCGVTVDDIQKVLKEKGVLGITLELNTYSNEKEMIASFFNWFANQNFDAIIGWYSEMFDIPYIGNRVLRIMSRDVLGRLSPFGAVKKKTIEKDYGDDYTKFTFTGLIHLDLLEVYQKFTFKTQPSYSLDNVANYELGVGKLEHGSGIPGHFLYIDHPNAGVAYNIVDVLRLKQIDQSFGGTDMVIELAQMSNSNLDDVMSVTKLIINLMYDFLRKKNLYMPIKKERNPYRPIAGGYVAFPIVGKHENVVSFDLASSYPSIMRSLNISPEMKGPKLEGVSPDTLLKGEIPTLEGHCICANGQTFRNDFQGFIPSLLDYLYSQRQIMKANKLKYSKLAAETGEKVHKDLKKFWSNRDSAYKVILNSMYGALAEKNFLFYDSDLAEAITLTGQYLVKKMGKDLVCALGKEINVMRMHKSWEKFKHAV